ncbi:MAG: beta-hydroxyacyl-ACP dehydratase [Planctomycetia bacterium]|nr:beta-hydroxyacyl-ACP dehydratase [Planctomycetia bacterium]
MRWFWIDRFVEFNRGETARAIKNVTLAEDHLHDHFPGYPVMPCSLIIEGMAQTGGILLAEKLNFESLVVMAKIPKAVFHSWACPGDTLVYDAKILDAREDGGIVECTARIGERPVAEAEYVFACLPNSQSKTACQENFLKTMQLLGAGDVGPAAAGPN